MSEESDKIKPPASAESIEKITNVTDNDDDDSLIIHDEIEEDNEAASVNIEDESAPAPPPPAQPITILEPVGGRSPQNTDPDVSSPSRDEEKDSGNLPADSSVDATDLGTLPVSESSILAATESVMEKLAAADDQKIKQEEDDCPVNDAMVEVGAEPFPNTVSVPGIETEPVSEGEMETEGRGDVREKMEEEEESRTEGVTVEEEGIPAMDMDTSTELVEMLEENSKSTSSADKEVELVSEEEEEELLLSDPDRGDELITEAITPPATTPPPPAPMIPVEGDQDNGNEILDISDPDEGDMLIEGSLAARTARQKQVVSIPLSPVRDITPVSPACQSPALVNIPSPHRDFLVSTEKQVSSSAGDQTGKSSDCQSPALVNIPSPHDDLLAPPAPSEQHVSQPPESQVAAETSAPSEAVSSPPAAVPVSLKQVTSSSEERPVSPVTTTQETAVATSMTQESAVVVVSSDSIPTESITPSSGSPALPIPSSACQPVSSTSLSDDPATTESTTDGATDNATDKGPPVVKSATAPPDTPHLEVPTTLALETSAPSTPDSSTVSSTSADQSQTQSTSRASSQEPGPSKKRKIPPTEKPFEPGIIWIKPEPVDPDEPQVIPPPGPDQQPGPSSGVAGGSRKRRLVEKQVSGLPSAPPNVHVTATQAPVGEDVQGQLQKILQSSSSGNLLCSLLAQLPQELTSSLLSKVLHQQQLQNQGSTSSPSPNAPISSASYTPSSISSSTPSSSTSILPVAQGVAVYDQHQSRNVPARPPYSPGYQGGDLSRLSPGKLAQKYPPLPQLPRQHRQQGSRTQSSSSQSFPTANLQKTQQLLNESTYLQSQLQNSQHSTRQSSPQPSQGSSQPASGTNFQQSPIVRPAQSRAYLTPHVQSAPLVQQSGTPQVQSAHQSGSPQVQPALGANTQQGGGTAHQQNNNLVVGNSSQMQTLTSNPSQIQNTNQYKSNNQGLQPMVIPLSDIQTLVGIDDQNKQTVILSDELNTLRRATNATIIRAGQQGGPMLGKQQPQQLVGQQQQQIGQMVPQQQNLQQSHANIGQMSGGQQGHLVPQQQASLQTQPAVTPSYAQPHPEQSSGNHQQKLLPKTAQHRQTTPVRRAGKEKHSNEIICIDSDDEGSDKGETAARCRVYVRDEQKIAVIFDMMKRKCVKTDVDRTGLPPNIVNVPQNSLPDLQPIVNVSGNLQGYLVHGQTPFLLTPVSGSSHLFTVHQNGKETATRQDQTFPSGTILNLKAMLEKDPPALPPLPASSIPPSLTAPLPPAANPINISTSTVINYQPVFLNQQQGAGSQLVYTSSQQPLSRDASSEQTRDGGVQYVVVEKSNNSNLQVSTASMNTGRLPHVDNKQTLNNPPTIKPTMGTVSRDGLVFHNITFSTAENGTTTRVNPALNPGISPSINAASVFSNQVEARAARVMVGSSTKRYMPIAPAPGNNTVNTQRPLLLPNQAPAATFGAPNQQFIQPAHLQPAQPAHLQPAQPALLQPTTHLQPQSGQFSTVPSGHMSAGPGPSGQTIIAQTLPGTYTPFPHEQTIQQTQTFQNIQPQSLQSQRVYNVLNLQPFPQPQMEQQNQIPGHQQQRQTQQQQQQQLPNQHPQPPQQPSQPANPPSSGSKTTGDREAKLKMVMNSLSQVLSLPIQQQKEVFKNNPILRQLLMKRNAADQEQRKDPPPPYPDPTRALPKKSTGPPGPGRVQPILGGTARGQGAQQRTILPKPNEQSSTQKITGEHKMERDAHERWLQLSKEQQSVILAAAKEKVSKLKKNELQLLLNAAYQHMHKVPPDMRKALLIAAQERMDKLSGKTTEHVAGSSSTVPASKGPSSRNKDDDDLVILQEVPCRESRTKVTIRDETGEVVTLLGRPAESLPRLTSRYSQTWRTHFSGCARTRAIVKTTGLPTTLLPDLSVWREREDEAASVTSSCARVRPYHRAVGSKSRIKRTGGVYGQDKRFPVRQEVSKIVTRLRKFHCERSRGSKASELTNVFSLTDEGLDDVAECIARAYVKEKKRTAPPERRRGRPTRHCPASKPLGPQMPKITVCRSSGETPLHKSAQQGWAQNVLQCLQAGEDINVRDNAGWTPLHEATAKNRIAVVTLLLEHNADVNVASSTTGVRPIHDAVLHDHVEIAELLLAAGADPKLPTFSGKLPSDFCRSTKMSELLDKYIAKLTKPGSTPPGWGTECVMEISELPHMPSYKLALDGPEEKNYYLLTDLIARLNISRSTFSQNYPAFKTFKMKWKDFAKLLGKSPYFVHPERLPSQLCEFIELNDDANRILGIRSEVFEP